MDNRNKESRMRKVPACAQGPAGIACAARPLGILASALLAFDNWSLPTVKDIIASRALHPKLKGPHGAALPVYVGDKSETPSPHPIGFDAASSFCSLWCGGRHDVRAEMYVRPFQLAASFICGNARPSV